MTEASAGPALLTARAAIVHDWFQGFHGSERVAEAMRTGLFAPGSEADGGGARTWSVPARRGSSSSDRP